VLDRQKKWIGNATVADYVIIWARDVEDGQAKGFAVEKGTSGLSASEVQGDRAEGGPEHAHLAGRRAGA
jgi:glutaryl-CoA dehydrogenase